MELEIVKHPHKTSGLTMAAITHVFTITHVAAMLGETEEFLEEIAEAMEPEDGCLFIVGLGEDRATAFTQFGIENLRELIADTKR